MCTLAREKDPLQKSLILKNKKKLVVWYYMAARFPQGKSNLNIFEGSLTRLYIYEVT